ncbi:sensor domain-containing diguanylate cyclase [Leptolyngbya iicbica]|uniref:Diguanylate cyclase n=1 Tax=Lyngbya confervoides BDU141951 TaxID=1574623 RepID=A0A8T6QT13_9CYAN|nr:diguanylate cyclase [Leptolyngbya sp. LK]
MRQLFNFRQIPLWQQAIAAAAYVSTGYVSLFALDPVSGFTVLWIPSGVSVGLIYIWGYPIWLGTVIGNVIAQIIFFNGLSTVTDVVLTPVIVMSLIIGHLLGAYWTAHLIQNRYFLGRAKDTICFIVCNCLLGPCLAVVIVPLSLCLLGKFSWELYLSLVITTWIGEAFVIVTVTPLIITWHQNAPVFQRLVRQQPLEGLLLLCLALTVSQIAFMQGYPVAYLSVTLIIWAAFRFGDVGATLLMVGITAIAVLGTVRGQSTFAQDSVNSSLVLLQSFIAFISLTTLTLSAVLNENERAKTDLKSTNAMLTQFLNALPIGVSVHNQQGHTLYSNAMAEQLLRPSSNAQNRQSAQYLTLYRQSANTICPPEHLPTFRALAGEHLLDDDLEIRHGDQLIPLEAQGTPILDERGRITSAIVVWQDISDRKRMAAILADYTHELELEVTQRTQELAHTNEQLCREIQERERTQQALDQAIQELQKLINLDGLTQIANRRCFDERIHREWQRAATRRSPLSLMLLDVDYFKRYNDLYGHQAGDECLIQVAQAAAQVVKRPDDLVARYGGEEFAILLPDTDLKGALAVAQRLQQAIEDLAIAHRGSEVSQRVTVSIGIAHLLPQADKNLSTLIHLADQALYEAKRLGRNQYVAL